MISVQLIDSQWEGLGLESQLLYALASLSPQGQRAINLRFWENYTIEEISECLGVSWDDADQIIEQSLKELKSLLIRSGVNSQMFQAS